MSARRNFLSLLTTGLVVALLSGLNIAQPTDRASAGTTPFTDIGSSIFRDDIEWLYLEGITKGCTTTLYGPNDPVTRDQMASFLVRMFDLEPTSQDFFTDDETSIHEADINRLAAAGITTGCSATTFCPKALVLRDQMASFLARAANLTVGAGRNYFYDDNGNLHEANIDRSAAAGIASGCNTWRYCPSNSVSREQMAAFLHRVVAPITPPPYPAPPPPTVFPTPAPGCDPSYPTVCIPPPPPDLNCDDVAYTNFTVLPPDPHGFDGNEDGIGCEN